MNIRMISKEKAILFIGSRKYYFTFGILARSPKRAKCAGDLSE